MKEKLLQKRNDVEADIIFYEEQLAKAKAKIDVIDEMVAELEDEELAPADEMAADPVETTPNNLY